MLELGLMLKILFIFISLFAKIYALSNAFTICFYYFRDFINYKQNIYTFVCLIANL